MLLAAAASGIRSIFGIEVFHQGNETEIILKRFGRPSRFSKNSLSARLHFVQQVCKTRPGAHAESSYHRPTSTSIQRNNIECVGKRGCIAGTTLDVTPPSGLSARLSPGLALLAKNLPHVPSKVAQFLRVAAHATHTVEEVLAPV